MRIDQAVERTLAAVAECDYGAGVVTRDRCDVIFLAAYGRAWRCLRSILDLARRSEAADAATLTRSLVSVAIRSGYIVQPDDPDERRKRLAQWIYTWRLSGAAMADELHTLGFPGVGGSEADNQRALAEEAKWAGRLPSDQELAKTLKMDALYSRVYRQTSDAAHFGLSTVIASFAEQPVSVTGDGATVSLDLPDPNRAKEVLTLAVITYGAFMALAEPIVKHGLTDTIADLIREAMAADSTTSSTA